MPALLYGCVLADLAKAKQCDVAVKLRLSSTPTVADYIIDGLVIGEYDLVHDMLLDMTNLAHGQPLRLQQHPEDQARPYLAIAHAAHIVNRGIEFSDARSLARLLMLIGSICDHAKRNQILSLVRRHGASTRPHFHEAAIALTRSLCCGACSYQEAANSKDALYRWHLAEARWAKFLTETLSCSSVGMCAGRISEYVVAPCDCSVCLCFGLSECRSWSRRTADIFCRESLEACCLQRAPSDARI